MNVTLFLMCVLTPTVTFYAEGVPLRPKGFRDVICERLGKEARNTKVCSVSPNVGQMLSMHHAMIPGIGITRNNPNMLFNYALQLGGILSYLQKSGTRNDSGMPSQMFDNNGAEYNYLRGLAQMSADDTEENKARIGLFEEQQLRKRIFDSIAYGVGFRRFK